MEIRLTIQHLFNSGHAYCRFRDCKIPKPIAKYLAMKWKRFIDPILYYRRKTNDNQSKN